MLLQKFTCLGVVVFLAGILLMAPVLVAQRPGAAAVSAPGVVPAEFIGDWVSAKGTCDSPVRFRAEGNRFTLINGQDSVSYGDLHMAASYFDQGPTQPPYSGISKAVMPDSNKNDPPFMAFFNHNEKKGVTLLDIYTAGPVSPHAAMAAIQMAHKKLAQRFPLNNIPLKKCAGGGSSADGKAAPAPSGPKK